MNKLKSIIYPDTLKAKLRFFIINLMLFASSLFGVITDQQDL